MSTATQQHCSFSRRIAVILYDSLLLLAVMFVATLLLMPLTGGEAIASENILYKVFLIFVSYLYFCWHWTRGGQTLGMRSWHVFVVNASDKNLNWKQASLRFLGAILSILPVGLGFVWSIFDKQKLALHDHLTNTRLVVDKDRSLSS